MHQTILDAANNKIIGLDKNSQKGLLSILTRLLDQFRSRADDVANWPNVRSHS